MRIFILFFLGFFLVQTSFASEVRFNSENWHTLPHPKVASFSVQSDGSAFGITENGISFTQYNVPNTLGIRVQRFEIQDHFHYIIDGVPVYTFSEFSAILAQAYIDQTGT
jgi:hypothetical protein